ncbi:MAG TPA: methyltransferase domain-containing protein [Anaeromyxobacteraceae bacterium]|nr:methyltransferase domain-containing protein [Anaeromyxobacteraceae bacterium]
MAGERQREIWNGPVAAGLLAVRAPLDAAVRPYGLAAMEALRPAVGERALDVGCGVGETTRELAGRVGPSGAALGVDVAERFVEVARRESAGCSNAEYLHADAQSHPFPDGFDLCYSRFGLMFFEDPPAAFRNLRGALRPAGRLAAVVWGPPASCAWVELPLRVLRGHRPGAGGPSTSGPGPFSLSDAAALARLAEGAGFAQVRVEALDLPFRCGDGVEAAADFLVRFGPAAAALREAGGEGERLRPVVAAELRELLAPWAGARGVELPSAALLLTAATP